MQKEKGEKAVSESKSPIEFQISTKELNLIQKYIKKIIRDNILIFIISFTACFLIALFISFLIPILFFVFFIIMIIGLGLLTGLLPLLRITRIKKRTNKKEDILELYPNYVILKTDGEIKKISLKFNTCLDFVKTYPSTNRPKERFDTIIIKERFDLKSNHFFGPIADFSVNSTTILSRILIWKIQNGFLFKRDELIQDAGIKY